MWYNVLSIETIALIEKLRTIDPNDLNFHADRYGSGDSFRTLLRVVRDNENHWLSNGKIGNLILEVTDHTNYDGGNYGTIPCLGGKALDVWEDCLEWLEHNS